MAGIDLHYMIVCTDVFIDILESLGIAEPSYYFYLNQSGTYKVDGTNDVKEFQDTMVRFFLISLTPLSSP